MFVDKCDNTTKVGLAKLRELLRETDASKRAWLKARACMHVLKITCNIVMLYDILFQLSVAYLTYRLHCQYEQLMLCGFSVLCKRSVIDIIHFTLKERTHAPRQPLKIPRL